MPEETEKAADGALSKKAQKKQQKAEKKVQKKEEVRLSFYLAKSLKIRVCETPPNTPF